MKINKIFIGGLAMLSMTACNDYLDVKPATNVADVESVFNAESEISKALNGVYAKIQTDATFGSNLYTTFQLNSDVDFYANANETAQGNQPRRFDVRADANNVESLWNNLYSGVETANEFIYNLKNSPLYKEETTIESIETEVGLVNKTVPLVTNLTQMMGEAKVMRAMFYHELLSYWGDIPFTLHATFETNNLLPPMTKRQEVSDSLIADLQHAAEYMKSDKDATLGAPERISQEAAYAMIARLALQAGGYSLNHAEGDATNYAMTRPSNYKDYYQIARTYTKRIIDAGGHSLNLSYPQVFIDECNYVINTGDDPIFEIPFAQGSTSSWGYAQGPASSVDANVETNYANSAWGATSGNAQVSYFYRHQFDEDDMRRDYVCGMWGYGAQGQPNIRILGSSVYSIYNNKWSKLWSSIQLGKSTTSATGINFAYIRYADVLLMFAEAENELNGPTSEAQNALKQVRRRAYYGSNDPGKVDVFMAQAASSKENFLKAVLDERKFEFAGENMRWKDLVRNNLYSEKLFYTFMTYLAVAEDMGGSTSYMDMVENYEGIKYSELYTSSYFYTYVENYNKGGINNVCNAYFPNNSLPMLFVVNPYGPGSQPAQAPQAYFDENGLNLKAISLQSITGLASSSSSIAWNNSGNSNSPDWSNDGTPRGQIYYSLFGYIRGDEQTGGLRVVSNGAAIPLNVNIDNPQSTVNSLPAVRYLLPIPEEAIARSSGAYKNYYGY
ncbi:MAG: RagB/SusD family nutrient uptake outer membrane protein [Prevotella sp.]|nr:RagB/SusD family nutrient uptake outer membrane protein [Prevotella sp.]